MCASASKHSMGNEYNTLGGTRTHDTPQSALLTRLPGQLSRQGGLNIQCTKANPISGTLENLTRIYVWLVQ